ncbi:MULTISPECIES: FkbM family methyltransferase [Asticcacaulis]|uniref:FkbM family methyltransferase n=1 Tax=Asticcacaulis TaxID=76890 RepID=UPI001AE9FF77|nr:MULTISPECIES: FkbM family methyltransferase [Asticcacaulis]MBP2160960.1 FkbM family methyltransferase [Asticcacaulis solisilvae]MDR6802005.1 FkbM family methyltransferase [Asticcacaulis sp. BE141]
MDLMERLGLFEPGQIDFGASAFTAALDAWRERKRALDLPRRPLVLVGAGSVLAAPFVEGCLKSCNVIALLDNAKAGTESFGVPVIGDGQLPDVLRANPEAIGILCCGSERALDHFRANWPAGVPLLFYFEVLALWPGVAEAGPSLDFIGAFQDLNSVQAAYDTARRHLRDSLSLKTLDAVLLYRLTWAPEVLDGIRKPEKAIYFEPDVMPLHDLEVLVDGGAYDGDTARDFAAKTQNRYGHIHAFELDPAVAAAFAAKTAQMERVTLHSVGLWNGPDTLRLQHRTDNGGRISDAGEVKVDLVALDDIDVGAPTVIKLDVEGAEVNALAGAAATIRRHKPKLAICAYHKHDDLVTLFEAIGAIRDDYSFSLRHYSPLAYDTVIYAT